MERQAAQIRRSPGAGFEILGIAVGVLLLLEIYYDFLPFLHLADYVQDLSPEATNLLVAVLILLLVWLILRIAGRLFESATLVRFGSHAQARSAWRLITYVTWAVVLVAFVLILLRDLAITVVSAAVFAAALAFVLQRPLLNMVAWAVITYQRMYRIGDRVAIGETRGYVIDIGISHTVMREFGQWMQGDTFTGRIVSVPNSSVFDGPVQNYTKDIPYVWDEVETLVTYESDVDVAQTHMQEAAREVIGSFMKSRYYLYLRRLEIRDLEGFIMREPEIRMAFSDSGVKLYVLYFVPAEARRRIRSEITELIWRRFMEDPRVGIAYPHVEVVRHPESQPGKSPSEAPGSRAPEEGRSAEGPTAP